eukprot:TRINITY_DN1830_c0_g1_i10.p1 TRINITY_DN1830_c0_g1~~TRINITY_DN1830_c0_g1_i10.p1  ORF type:complete len:379 (-),score=46.50 TRINITY_DN1830_c0_g1_i10:467-1603(-)
MEKQKQVSETMEQENKQYAQPVTFSSQQDSTLPTSKEDQQENAQRLDYQSDHPQVDQPQQVLDIQTFPDQQSPLQPQEQYTDQSQLGEITGKLEQQSEFVVQKSQREENREQEIQQQKVEGEGEGEEQQQLQERESGTVKWFNPVKGFGFITPDADKDKDLFIHQSDIKSSGFRSLKQGARVEFETEFIGEGRTKAVNVTGPNGEEPEGAPFPRQQGAYYPSGPSIPYIIVQPGGRMGPPGSRGAGGIYYPYLPGRGGRGRQGRGGAPTFPPGMMGGYFFPPPVPTYQRVGGQQQEASSGYQAVVHNLPWQCTWQELKDAFAKWNVVRADIVYDQFGRSKGFGVVRFQTQDDATSAIQQMNNQMIAGRQVAVRLDKYG